MSGTFVEKLYQLPASHLNPLQLSSPGKAAGELQALSGSNSTSDGEISSLPVSRARDGAAYPKFGDQLTVVAFDCPIATFQPGLANGTLWVGLTNGEIYRIPTDIFTKRRSGGKGSANVGTHRNLTPGPANRIELNQESPYLVLRKRRQANIRPDIGGVWLWGGGFVEAYTLTRPRGSRRGLPTALKVYSAEPLVGGGQVAGVTRIYPKLGFNVAGAGVVMIREARGYASNETGNRPTPPDVETVLEAEPTYLVVYTCEALPLATPDVGLDKVHLERVSVFRLTYVTSNTTSVSRWVGGLVSERQPRWPHWTSWILLDPHSPITQPGGRIGGSPWFSSLLTDWDAR
ncbi:hypothetical protein L0F63_006581 [Massospora cicadina]|nr:hypothetical protein L0F63_006581 [Massospora cicadina]